MLFIYFAVCRELVGTFWEIAEGWRLFGPFKLACLFIHAAL
jgi:hypothetical protein